MVLIVVIGILSLYDVAGEASQSDKTMLRRNDLCCGLACPDQLRYVKGVVHAMNNRDYSCGFVVGVTIGQFIFQRTCNVTQELVLYRVNKLWQIPGLA